MNAPTSPPQPKAGSLRLDVALQLLQQSGLALPDTRQSDPAGWLQAVLDGLCELSSRDALTGLSNRRQFELAMAREIDRVARAGEPALVLMDCEMPVMNGYQATEKIRQWERQNGKLPLPIIALTADAFEENRQRCFAAGMDDFLSKPINMNLLTAPLNKWMSARARGTNS